MYAFSFVPLTNIVPLIDIAKASLTWTTLKLVIDITLFLSLKEQLTIRCGMHVDPRNSTTSGLHAPREKWHALFLSL